MEENINVNETTEEIGMTEIEESTENSNGSLIVKIVSGIGLVAAAAGVYVYKTKDKREKRQIEKLRKKGYKIYEPTIEVTEYTEDPDDIQE